MRYGFIKLKPQLMTPGQKIKQLQTESRAKTANGDFERSIHCIHELIGLLKEDKISQRIAALEWHRMACMYIRMKKPKEAELAVRNALDAYLRNRALFQGEWRRERDEYIAQYAMTLARCLIDQQRYEEALPYMEESATIFRHRGEDAPLMKQLVLPKLDWLRPRAEAQRAARNNLAF